MKRRFHAVKGTRDVLPPDSGLWNRVEQTAREVFRAYNYQEIRLPIFEETELFARSVGADTDIVSKEMYTFGDRTQQYLDAVRSVLMLSTTRLDQPGEIRNFVSLLLQFLTQARKALENGEIPKTNKNASLLNALSDHANEASSVVIREPHESKHIDWYDLRKNVVFLVSVVDLGPTLTLRPEATASVVRAYIEHGLHTRPGLTKLYYIGPMFRRERPQKGRFRQFYQIGAEVLGSSDHPALDAEIIELVLVFIERCGLKGCHLYVNSIGCPSCRPKYVELLKSELQKVKSKLGPDSQRRIETNPLRVLDSKLEQEQPVIEKLSSILDHLCPACRDHYEKVKQELKGRSIPFEENWRLVRGLDYYVRTTFEVTAPGLGAQNAVCGGGRYDGLVELLGGPPTKGTGWALGTDRLILALQQAATAKPETPLDVFIVWLGQPAYARARQLARRLRDAGTSVDLTYEEAKLKKALGLADRAGARFALLLGDDELAQNKVTLREMQSGHQRSLSEEELLRQLSAQATPSRSEG